MQFGMINVTDVLAFLPPALAEMFTLYLVPAGMFGSCAQVSAFDGIGMLPEREPDAEVVPTLLVLPRAVTLISALQPKFVAVSETLDTWPGVTEDGLAFSDALPLGQDGVAEAVGVGIGVLVGTGVGGTDVAVGTGVLVAATVATGVLVGTEVAVATGVLVGAVVAVAVGAPGARVAVAVAVG